MRNKMKNIENNLIFFCNPILKYFPSILCPFLLSLQLEFLILLVHTRERMRNANLHRRTILKYLRRVLGKLRRHRISSSCHPFDGPNQRNGRKSWIFPYGLKQLGECSIHYCWNPNLKKDN